MSIIATGTFATIFSLNEQEVIKWSTDLDDGLVFAKWCLDNQGRAGVPEIHALYVGEDYYVVVMRKYVTFPESTWDSLSYETLEHVCQIEQSCYKPQDQRDVPVEYKETLNELFQTFDKQPDCHPGNIAFDVMTKSYVVLDPFNGDF